MPSRTGGPDASIESSLRALHAGLTERPMPEAVAAILLRLPGLAALHPLLRRAARSEKLVTYMSDAWFEPVPPARQIATALGLFAAWLADHPAPDPITPEERDPGRIRAFIAHLSRSIAKVPGENDGRAHRLPRAGREAAGLDMGGHAYAKRFRFLARFEGHLATYEKELRFRSHRLVGKCGLVAGIPFERFAASQAGAGFLSYYAARRKRRSIFTNGRQPAAFDEVSDALLRLCRDDPAADWALIARIHPEPDVLARLDADATARLIGAWTDTLGAAAADLEAAWQSSRINLDTMVVRRGNDSSTWNLAAGAWNAARNGWMALLAQTGQTWLLDQACPGKVLRLMAGDVAHWHRMSGGSLHPDTLVWRALPKPWRVLRGEERCTRATVQAACAAAGLDPRASGWLEARVPTEAVATEPTPELVHGVAVHSPFLGLLLRQAGVFSGKAVRWDRLQGTLGGA